MQPRRYFYSDGLTGSCFLDSPFRLSVCAFLLCILCCGRAAAVEVIVDNSNAAANATAAGYWEGTGDWENVGAGGYSDNARKTNDDNKWVTWRPTITVSGTYEVFARWQNLGAGPPDNRTDKADYKVYYSGGDSGALRKAQKNGPFDTWVSLGSYPFVAGTAGYVRMENESNGKWAVADAVRFYMADPDTTTTPATTTATATTTTPAATTTAAAVTTTVAASGGDVSSHVMPEFAINPINMSQIVTPMVVIASSSDHQFFFKAYNDYSDLNEDGEIETTYTHSIDYYGYFDSYKCYEYDTTDLRFEPKATTSDKYCTGANANYWSGNFLNWASMARIDTTRKILFGGHRRVDTAADTVLERTYLPHDAHAWAKYYNGADLQDLTPFTAGADYLTNDADAKKNGITLCNTTDVADTSDYSHEVTDPPLIKVAKGNYSLWAGNERWQCTWDSGAATDNHAATNANDSANSGIYAYSASPAYSQGIGAKKYVARVQACVSGLIGKEKCKQYPSGNYKPVGLMQVYGDNDQLYFSQVAGSYSNHAAGGILIQEMGSIRNEVNVTTDGTFSKVAQFAGGPRTDNTAEGLINAWSLWRLYGYSHGDGEPGSYNNVHGDNCPWGLSDYSDILDNGKCTNWGNPFGEIYFNAIRYLSKAGISGTYQANDSTYISGLNTPQNWSQDFLTSTNYCARLNIVNFNNSAISFDGDQLDANSPGVQEVWSTAVLPGNDTSAAMTDVVGQGEGIHGFSYLIGETDVSNQADGDNQLCTAKTIASLGLAGGICPEVPRLAGTYRIAGLAFYAHTQDIRADALGPSRRLTGEQKVDTYSVSGVSATPAFTIRHPTNDNVNVQILPACRNTGLNPDGNCTIVDFKVVSHQRDNGAGVGTGKLYVNWEDSEQGGDYDQDMWGIIEYRIDANTNTIDITTKVYAESTIFAMAFGYVITGTSEDGFHAHSGIEGYTYNDPATITAGADCTTGCNVGDAASTARYTLGISSAEMLLDPLWYAAKWGGFTDKNNSGTPDRQDEWDVMDKDGVRIPDGIPDNYFYAHNPMQLEASLNRVFLSILQRVSSGTAAAVVSNNVSGEGAIYQAYFEPSKQDTTGRVANWFGSLHAMWLDSYGYMREDDGDAILEGYNTDRVVESFFDDGEGRTRVLRHTSLSDTAFTPYYMKGTVTAYDSTTGAITFTVSENSGSAGNGPFADWYIYNLNTNAKTQSASSNSIVTSGSVTFTITAGAIGVGVGDKVMAAHFITDTIELSEVGTLWNARQQMYYPNLTDNDLKAQDQTDGPTNASYVGHRYADLAAATSAQPLAGRRYIMTWIDDDNDGVLDAGEFQPFTSANLGGGAMDLGHFDVTNATDMDNLVDYIRGVEISGYRNRTVDYNGDGTTEVMRLGDIVNSTPTVVGRPAEAFDLLYRDSSYATFRQQYVNRRNVIYVGANDGLLHAFNAGFYDSSTYTMEGTVTAFDSGTGEITFSVTSNEGAVGSGPFGLWKVTDTTTGSSTQSTTNTTIAAAGNKTFTITPGSLSVTAGDTIRVLHQANRYLTTGKKYDGVTDATPHPLGSEIWAYAPLNLLPHLKWLKRSDYSHVYYVDGKPRVFDARIFNVSASDSASWGDAEHPGGWGTVLVVGMRLGGGRMTIDVARDGLGNPHAADDKERRSAFMMFDITNPENPPILLKEFQVPDGSFSAVYPTPIAFVNLAALNGVDDNLDNKWFLAFGSGPSNITGQFTAESTSTAKLYLLNLNDRSTISTFDTGKASTYLGSPVSVDWDLDFKADTLYFGLTGTTSAATGYLQRFAVDEDPNPANWGSAMATVVNATRPITAPPTPGIDEVGNHWVYFGTGRLFSTADTSTTASEYLFGVKDPYPGTTSPATPYSLADLLDVTSVQVFTDGTILGGPGGVNSFTSLKTYLENSASNHKYGWYINLPPIYGVQGTAPSTRSLTQSSLAGAVLFSSVYQPNTSQCESEGYSRLYGLYYKTGTAYPDPSVLGTREVDVSGVKKEQANVAVELGRGFATTPALHSGSGSGDKEVSVFTQLSTGAIMRTEAETVESVRSGKRAWREVY